MKKCPTIIGIILLIAVAGGGLVWYSNQPPKERHVHAGFQVYIDGKIQNYSDIKYMSFYPCLPGNKKTKDQIEDETAHLHDHVGDVVHSHREGATWSTLFKNIKVNLDTSKGVTGYVNGEMVEDILDFPIRDNDSVTIIIGDVDDAEQLVKNRVTVEYIKTAVKNSRDCGT